MADDTLSRVKAVNGGAFRGHVRLKNDCIGGEFCDN